MGVKLKIVKDKKAKKMRKNEIENIENLSSIAESKSSAVEINAISEYANKFILRLSFASLLIIVFLCVATNFSFVGLVWLKIMNFEELNFNVGIFVIVMIALHLSITTFWMPLQYYTAQTIDKGKWTQDEFNAFKDDFRLRLILLCICSVIVWLYGNDKLETLWNTLLMLY